MKFLSVFILTISLFNFSFGAVSDFKVTCKDEAGKALDWFSAYKLPKDSDSADPNIKEGSGYVYLTEQRQNWTMGKAGFDDQDSIAAKTFSILYNTAFTENGKIGYVIYNDQYGERALQSRAHAKGVLIFDDKSAIWVIHSIPHYPAAPVSKSYFLDPKQMKYGQSMLCVTVPFSALEKIAHNLLFAWPQVADSFFPAGLSTNPVLKNLIRVAKEEKYTVAKSGLTGPLGWGNREDIFTVDNTRVAAFYKHTQFNSDIYSELVAKELKSNLYSLTWSNGIGGVLGSDCKSTFSVYNIKRLLFKAFQVVFKVNSDHSKWVISDPKVPAERAFCIGDVNRMASQFKRGGGTTCIINKQAAWNSYKQIIDEVEPCPVA